MPPVIPAKSRVTEIHQVMEQCTALVVGSMSSGSVTANGMSVATPGRRARSEATSTRGRVSVSPVPSALRLGGGTPPVV